MLEIIKYNQKMIKEFDFFFYSKEITKKLMLNSSFIENLGLMHGKMGISIYFFHLSRFTKEKVYEEYAGELIDEINEELHPNIPIDFEDGLAGIGWGIEYLSQNSFIDADTDEILSDFDEHIYKAFLNDEFIEIGLLNGLIGAGAYFLNRINNKKNIINRTNKLVINDLLEKLHLKLQTIQIKSLINGERTNKTFDIMWEFSSLLFFLAELAKHDEYIDKIQLMCNELITILNSEIFNIQNSRLLLIQLSLARMLQTINSHDLSMKIMAIQTHISSKINLENIKTELIYQTHSVRHGIFGILWILKQLNRLIPEVTFEKEIENWYRFGIKLIETNKHYFLNINDDINMINNKLLGILEGYSGIVLTGLFDINKWC